MKLLTCLIMLTMLVASCGGQYKSRKVLTLKSEDAVLGYQLIPNHLGKDPKINGFEEYALTIQKEGLGGLLLLSSSVYESLPFTRGLHFDSKLVYFEKKGPYLYLFQSTEGLLESQIEGEDGLLLAQFSIISENEKEIVFEFNKGIKDIITFESTPKDSVVTFIKKISFINNKLVVEQQIQTQEKSIYKKLEFVFETYVKNPSFKATEALDFKHDYFFKTEPISIPQEEKKKEYLVQIDRSKKQIFYLSPKIPKELIQAVKEGVLYWNKAFKKEIVGVELLTKAMPLGHRGFHYIHWEDRKNSTMAYADTRSDPMTGEVLDSNIYLNDMSYEESVTKAFQKFFKKDDTKKIHLKGFLAKRLCEHSLESEPVHFDKALFEKSKVDSTRQTIAHEVGHVLGLRHNFAASTDGTIIKDDLIELRDQYEKGLPFSKDVTISSSVMDYLPSYVDPIFGRMILDDPKALPYDETILQIQSNESDENELVWNFCNDDDLGKSIDCRPYDIFSSPATFALFEYDKEVNDLPLNLIEQLKEPKMAAQYFPVNYGTLLGSLVEAVGTFVKSASKGAMFVSIKDQYPKVSSNNYDLYQSAILDFQTSMIKSEGGFLKVFKDDFLPTPEIRSLLRLPLTRRLFEKTKLALKKDKIEGLDEKSLENIFIHLDRHLIVQISNILLGIKLNINEPEFVSYYQTFISELIFTTTPTPVGTYKGATVYTPYYKSVELRDGSSLRALGLTMATTPPFSKLIDRYTIRQAILTQYGALIAPYISSTDGSFPEDIPNSIREFLLEDNSLIQNLQSNLVK